MFAQYGKIKFFPETMGNRRVHASGLWSSADKKTQLSYMLNTLYYMIGNYNEETNNYLIAYHLKLLSKSMKENIILDIYPNEILQISRILNRYNKIKKIAQKIGLIRVITLFNNLNKKGRT
jgi:hypothetical protein